jgi:hypothetical protein
MANRRISDLQEIAGIDLDEQDLFTVVHVAEVDPALKNKKLTISGTKTYLNLYYLPRTGGTVSGSVVIQNNLTVSGNTTTSGLTVAGAATLNSIIVQTNAKISGALTANQITGAQIVSTAIVQGPTVSGNTITGNTGQFTSGLFTYISVTATGKSGFGTAIPLATVDVVGNYTQSITAVAALNLDLATSNYFTKTINADSAFTVSNTPSDRAYSFTLEVTHTSGIITWFSGVEWPGGNAPTLTTGKTHLFMFVTDNGGARWRGASLINYTN